MPITNGSIPHFDLPFRFVPKGGVLTAATVEQDTLDDVFNCINMAVHYRRGQRHMVPTFGITDPTFDEQPIDMQRLVTEATLHELRADIAASQESDRFDSFIVRALADVSLRSRA